MILVVDDEPAIRDAVAVALRREGMPVEQAGTLHAGLAALAQGPQLAIADLGLPDGSGFELVKAAVAAGIPVVVLTARSEDADAVLALELGADDFIAKPFSPRVVAARIRAVLRRRQGPAAPAQAPAIPLAVDRRRMRAELDGRTLPLSRQELRVLLVLAEHPGEVFSRSRLLDLAWDDPASAYERTVDSHVKAIREAIRSVRPDATGIATMRGEGYALAVDGW